MQVSRISGYQNMSEKIKENVNIFESFSFVKVIVDIYDLDD